MTARARSRHCLEYATFDEHGLLSVEDLVALARLAGVAGNCIAIHASLLGECTRHILTAGMARTLRTEPPVSAQELKMIVNTRVSKICMPFLNFRCRPLSTT
jgi:hypothetical protein